MSFNVFTKDVGLNFSHGETSATSTDYLASGFHSVGDNVFSASNGIHIIVPQISGTRNTFDALVVNLENRTNVRESHSSSSGVGLSTDLAESEGLMASMNIGTSGSRNTYLNEAYIRGAVDFTRAEVTNQGCCVMDITNSGASYRYVPMEEVHKSRNFAIGLSGLDLSSADAFAYSLGRGLASAASSAGVGMLASEAGLGGFVSTIAASLAGAYVNSEVMPQIRDDNHRPTGLGSNSTVSYEHNGQGFNAINLDFDKSELDAVINKIKENIFTEALDRKLTTKQAVHKVQKTVEQFTQEVAEEKAKVDTMAELIDDTEKSLRDEIKSSIGDSEVKKLAEGKSISTENRAKVVKSLSKSIQRLVKEKAKLNLHASSKLNEVQQASLQTQNELIDEKLQQYSLLSKFLSRTESPKLNRSNSADNLLQDTYIRQGQRAFGIVADSFISLAHEADSMNYHDYVELQRSRLPVEAQNNPEVLAKMGVGYALYKGAAKVGQEISELDDATGNVVSGAMHKLGEGFEWLGTHTRRFIRDDLGFSQRVGQNTGDVVQIAAEIFAPSTVIKGVGSVSRIVGASKFSSALGEKFGLFKGDVSAAKIGLNWNGAILGEQSYGMAFENYLATLPEFSGIRLPKNFKTFDFWNWKTGRAVSAKTLNTNTPARLLNPDGIYSTLKGYVDKTLDFTQYGKGLKKPITGADILSREIQLGIPANTGKAQMEQIQRAVDYGKLNNVDIKITRIGK